LTLKAYLKEELTQQGYSIADLGTHTEAAVDYPDIAAAMAEALMNKPEDRGILICGSGIGISIAANRYRHLRAALCHDHLSARLARLHNDANILVLGSGFVGMAVAMDATLTFLNTAFEGGRHAARVDKMG
jgi:ribose 5-phosphate isomerase B